MDSDGFAFLPMPNFNQQSSVACQKQGDNKRNDEYEIIKQKIQNAFQINRAAVVQIAQYHKIRTTGARKFRKPDQCAQQKSGRRRSLFHQYRHFFVGAGGNFQFYRKFGKKFVYQIDAAENYKNRRADFRHKMRRAEKLQRLRDSQPDQNINKKNAENIRAADFQYPRTRSPALNKNPIVKSKTEKAQKLTLSTMAAAATSGAKFKNADII